MPSAPDLTVIVLTWNTRARTLGTLAAVPAGAAPYVARTVLVDNASDDGTADAVRAAYPDVQVVVTPRNLGFARGMAAAAPHLAGEVVVALNSDAVPSPGALAALVDVLRSRPDVVVAAPPTVAADGAPVKSAWRFPTLAALARAFTPLGWLGARRPGGADAGRPAPTAGPGPTPVETVSGACVGLRRADWVRLGGFDVGFPFFMEDVDLCWRVRASGGLVVVLSGTPPVQHAGGASTGTVRGSLRLPLLQGTLRHLRRRLSPVAFSVFGGGLKLGVVARTVLAAAGCAVVGAVPGARGARARAALDEHRDVLDHDLRGFVRAAGGPARLRVRRRGGGRRPAPAGRSARPVRAP